MDEIRAWLNGSRQYEEGAKLYLIHGKDHLLRRIFMEPASDFKRAKLVEALKGLLGVKTAVAKKLAFTKAVAIEHIAVSDRKWPKEKDATLAALHEKWKPLFAEMMSLSSRIYDVAKAGQHDMAQHQEAGRMAHRICDLDDECDDIYAQRDYYLQHGKLPEEKKPYTQGSMPQVYIPGCRKYDGWQTAPGHCFYYPEGRRKKPSEYPTPAHHSHHSTGRWRPPSV